MPLTKAQRVTAFCNAIAMRLKQQHPALRKVLAKLVEHEYPADFWQLDFEVHEFGADFPVCAYFYREAFDQVFDDDAHAKSYPFAAAKALHRLKQVYPASLEKRYRIKDDEYWFEEAATKELIPWFRACWLAAGGAKFKHRVRLASHDTNTRLDLVTGKWKKADQ